MKNNFQFSEINTISGKISNNFQRNTELKIFNKIL